MLEGGGAQAGEEVGVGEGVPLTGRVPLSELLWLGVPETLAPCESVAVGDADMVEDAERVPAPLPVLVPLDGVHVPWAVRASVPSTTASAIEAPVKISVEKFYANATRGTDALNRSRGWAHVNIIVKRGQGVNAASPRSA